LRHKQRTEQAQPGCFSKAKTPRRLLRVARIPETCRHRAIGVQRLAAIICAACCRLVSVTFAPLNMRATS
jgi:hypothetical protein